MRAHFLISALLLLTAARVSELPARTLCDNPALTEASAAGESYDGAHISFYRTSHDFGEVERRGGDITAEFPFVNDGTEPLVITRVTKSCTCIRISWPKRPIRAGGRGVIKITYEPHKMEAGTFRKVVQVHSNSVDGLRLLTVQGNADNIKRRRQRDE